MSLPWVAYDTGLVLPVSEACRAAREGGAVSFVDAYQALGVLPADVNEIGCDFLVAGTQKFLLGLPGVAFLYCRAVDSGSSDPLLTGWFGRVNPFEFNPENLDFAPDARRLETATPAIPSIVAANAGFSLISQVDPHRVRSHVVALMSEAAGRLSESGEDVALAGTVRDQGGHVAIRDENATRLAAALAEQGVHTSPRGRYVRLAFHYYNNLADVDRLCAAVREARSAHRIALSHAGG